MKSKVHKEWQHGWKIIRTVCSGHDFYSGTTYVYAVRIRGIDPMRAPFRPVQRNECGFYIYLTKPKLKTDFPGHDLSRKVVRVQFRGKCVYGDQRVWVWDGRGFSKRVKEYGVRAEEIRFLGFRRWGKSKERDG